jgi:hypothetical protein
MAKISRDQAIPVGGLATLHPRETLFITGNLAANGAEVVLPVDGCSSFALDLRGTGVMTIEVQGSIDGVNWILLPIRPLAAASVAYLAAISYSSSNAAWTGSCGGFRLLRARVTAFTSGSATAVLIASTAPVDQSLQGMVTPLIVTSVGAAGAAVTLTLPAPGAGLRQYVTYLSINRFATALLTAAAAPVTVTTTNLPGSLAFSFAADAAAQGTIDRWREDFAFPIAAAALNTAVTIVAPATTAVIWRLTAGYYIAP